MFAYGDNLWDATVQNDVVSNCFSYGRTYRGGRNYRQYMAAPWIQNTNSILGGNCDLVGAPCYSELALNDHYTDPQSIANLYQVPGDEWVDVQFYRLVTGQSNLSRDWSWNCTSPDWRLHWTSQTEFYCLNDFDLALSEIAGQCCGHRPGNSRRSVGSRNGHLSVTSSTLTAADRVAGRLPPRTVDTERGDPWISMVSTPWKRRLQNFGEGGKLASRDGLLE